MLNYQRVTWPYSLTHIQRRWRCQQTNMIHRIAGATSRYLGCFCIHCGRNHKATDCRGNIACLPLLAVFFPTFPPSNYQNDPRHSCLFASRKLSWAVLCKLDLLVPTSTIKKKKKCLPNMGTICILEFWWFFLIKRHCHDLDLLGSMTMTQ